MNYYCGKKNAGSHSAAFIKIMKTKRNLIQIWLLCAAMLQSFTSGAQPVTKIAGGSAHSLFLKSDGSLWAMGANGEGELGDGTNNDTNLPKQIVTSNVTAIAAGHAHSLFLQSDGSLWAMGYNGEDELGDGTTNWIINHPEQVVPSNRISVQLFSNGSVYLSFEGLAGTNYALESTFNLTPANWIPQVTNPAGPKGVLVFTNTPVAGTNNFWRIRSVP
jgi:hypothetical protein